MPTPIKKLNSLLPASAKIPAIQGINPWDLVCAFRTYVQLTADLDARHCRIWFGSTRPHLQGSDFFIWFRPASDTPDRSPGPGRWGNRSGVIMELHLVMRHFDDESQIDERKGIRFYTTHWKLEQALQNLNLFDSYDPPPTSGLWYPPQTNSTNQPLTIEPMTLSVLNVPDKTQKEEGTLEAVFAVSLPVVLALTVP